ALTGLAVGYTGVDAQDTVGPLPPRLQPLLKNDRFRLVRVLGTPEVLPIYHHASTISADGKRGIYAEDLSTGDDDARQLRTRLHVWDLTTAGWPRELEFDGKNVTALAISPDGSRALLAGQIYVGKPIIKDKAKDKAGAADADLRGYLSLWDLQANKEIAGVST